LADIIEITTANQKFTTIELSNKWSPSISGFGGLVRLLSVVADRRTDGRTMAIGLEHCIALANLQSSKILTLKLVSYICQHERTVKYRQFQDISSV